MEKLRTMELEEWEILGVITVTILGRWLLRPILYLLRRIIIRVRSPFSLVPTNAESNPSESETWGRLSSEIASSCIGGRRHLALPIIFGFPRRMLAADNSAR